MGAGILTRWPIVQEIAVSPDDLGLDGTPNESALRRWRAEAWDAYLDRCPNLRGDIGDGRARVDLGPLRLGSCHHVMPGVRALVATAMTELRSSSFDMALRIRALGSDGGLVADGRYSVVMVEKVTSSPLVIPGRIWRELLAVEGAASDYC